MQNLDYEDLIAKIMAGNPQNCTELITSIESILGNYDPDVLQIIISLNSDLKTISNIEGPSRSSSSFKNFSDFDSLPRWQKFAHGKYCR